MVISPCPICGAATRVPILECDRLPVHSVVLYESPAAAASEPEGRISLLNCVSCGFVSNAAFDPGLMRYDSRYESTQSFSPHYRDFQRALARSIAKAAAGREGPIVDVGCGQGEMLAELIKAGARQVLGFDPAFDKQRSSVGSVTGATIVAEEFDPSAVSGAVAAVVCKMTLEHVADPVALLRQLAAVAVRGGVPVPVFVQVPDAMRLFALGHFWDVIYEHCNYFTSHSLARAFHEAGLGNCSIKVGYHGQYLMAAAPGSEDSRAKAAAQATTTSAGDALLQNAAQWQEWVRLLVAEGARLAIWGAGSKTVSFLAFTEAERSIIGAVDINPHKAGTFLPGSSLPVYQPAAIGDLGVTHLLLANPAYEDEVGKMLSEMNLSPKLEVLFGAPPRLRAT